MGHRGERVEGRREGIKFLFPMPITYGYRSEAGIFALSLLLYPKCPSALTSFVPWVNSRKERRLIWIPVARQPSRKKHIEQKAIPIFPSSQIFESTAVVLRLNLGEWKWKWFGRRIFSKLIVLKFGLEMGNLFSRVYTEAVFDLQSSQSRVRAR